MTLFDRLNLIGVTLTDEQRDNCGEMARILRKFAATVYQPKPHQMYVATAYDDELGALADQLDTLAGPIVVQR